MYSAMHIASKNTGNKYEFGKISFTYVNNKNFYLRNLNSSIFNIHTNRFLIHQKMLNNFQFN